MVKSKKDGGIFSALGAATGLGNAMRFPSLCANYGGAFIFAYALCLVFVCFPLLCAELNIGKSWERVKAGRDKKDKIAKMLLCCAALNSAAIALYYGVIGAKIGGAFFCVCAGVDAGEAKGVNLFALCALFAFAVWLVLCKRGRIARLGVISVSSSLTLLAILAFAAMTSGGSFFRVFGFRFSALLCGGLWIDALAQALLSLSLAGGVMPAFARSFNKDFKVGVAAARIIFANFCGCILAATAALCLPVPVPEEGGVIVALTIYPGIIASAFTNAISRRVFGALFFAALSAVAVQSACSLFSPVIELSGENKRGRTAIALCALSCVLSPVFASCGGAIFHAVDRMACSVNAVIIAFSECIFFVCTRNMPSRSIKIRKFFDFASRFLCTFACGALALFSLCGARFSAFPPTAIFISALTLIGVFTPVAISLYRKISHKIL